MIWVRPRGCVGRSSHTRASLDCELSVVMRAMRPIGQPQQALPGGSGAARRAPSCATPRNAQRPQRREHRRTTSMRRDDAAPRRSFVGSFDELVHELCGGDVADATALFAGDEAEGDEQVAFAGAGVMTTDCNTFGRRCHVRWG